MQAIRRCALMTAAWLLASTAGHSSPVTLTSLSGSWDLRTVCMNNGGTSGACIEMKHGSLQFTFTADGRWHSEANDQSKTKKSGTYEVRGIQLILKVSEGLLYQNWQADITANGARLVVADKKLIETFERPKSAD